MFSPDYSLTNTTLNNIANIEYNKAVIETTSLLPNWQKQLKQEAEIEQIFSIMRKQGIMCKEQEIKRAVKRLPNKADKQVLRTIDTLVRLKTPNKTDIEPEDIKETFSTLFGIEVPKYRDTKLATAVAPDTILAEINQLLDWYSGLEGLQTHPLIKAAILKARLIEISPYKQGNDSLSDCIVTLCLAIENYLIKGYFSLESYYANTKEEYYSLLEDGAETQDYTRWIEYFTQGVNSRLSSVSEKVKILAKDARLAKSVGETVLSHRQERIVEYLQEFGILQNKDFAKLFPKISEDTVLRELKDLLNKDVIVKLGKTKSSRYELV